jgi:hypothetical protein
MWPLSFGVTTLSLSRVVDHANRLVGRITIDDIVDVLQEEANEGFESAWQVLMRTKIPQEMSTFRISRFSSPLVAHRFLWRSGVSVHSEEFSSLTGNKLWPRLFFIH